MDWTDFEVWDTSGFPVLIKRLPSHFSILVVASILERDFFLTNVINNAEQYLPNSKLVSTYMNINILDPIGNQLNLVEFSLRFYCRGYGNEDVAFGNRTTYFFLHIDSIRC